MKRLYKPLHILSAVPQVCQVNKQEVTLLRARPRGQLTWACPSCHLCTDTGAGGVRSYCLKSVWCWKQKPQGWELSKVIYMVSKGSISGKVPVDIFRSDAWSTAALSFLNKQGREWLMMCTVLFWKCWGLSWQSNSHPLLGPDPPSLPALTSEATDFSGWQIKRWPLAAKPETLKFVPSNSTGSNTLCRFNVLLDFYLLFLRTEAYVCISCLWLQVQWLRT